MTLQHEHANFGEEGVLQRLGTPLHYWVRGRPDAPTMLLLHGAGIDHRTWAPQVDAFAEEYRVVTVDLRGHGHSRPIGSYSFDTVVDDTVALLDSLEVTTAILVGLSMGGNVAQEIVFRSPERVRALVCLDCTCNTLVPPATRATLPIYEATFGPMVYAYPQASFVKSIGTRSAITKEAQRYVSEASAQLPKKDLVAVMKTLLAALHHEPSYRVEVPELLLHGVDDKLGNIRKVMPLWHQRDPGSEYVVVPDAGHVSNMDNPEFVNRTILEWLRLALPTGSHTPTG